MERTYLGDGVYAELTEDGALKLITSNGIRDTNVIFLDLQTFEVLRQYVSRHLQASLRDIDIDDGC